VEVHDKHTNMHVHTLTHTETKEAEHDGEQCEVLSPGVTHHFVFLANNEIAL